MDLSLDTTEPSAPASTLYSAPSTKADMTTLLDAIPEKMEDIFLLSAVDTALTQVLIDIAKDGKISKEEWQNNLKNLFRVKLYQLLGSFFAQHGFVGPVTETFEGRRLEIIELLDNFSSPPFTIQRLAELILDSSPYSATHKLLNAFEKLLLVSSGPEYFS